MVSKEGDRIKRYILKIYGIVQGVGFRPFIYNISKKNNIKGWVKNCGSFVLIDMEGSKENIKRFIKIILNNPPKLAKIEKINAISRDVISYKDFIIKPSTATRENLNFVSPDIATCSKCLEEVKDSNSKRYRYAFTNCTECGPRYSIIKALPYDRISTTMDVFKMCKACNEEYDTPSSRRFHTQPNCCKECGPTLNLRDKNNLIVQCKDIIKKTIEILKDGKIVAIKGLGGFHLVCDATNERAVARLRNKKIRPHKPLAIMVKNYAGVKKICNVNENERNLLRGEKKPIVLLEKKKKTLLPDNIAPRNNRIGVMLPYTPLHHLLFEENIEYLVMTSANRSGMPIEYKEIEAFQSLKEIADYFLIHNREINIPIDDSVVKVIDSPMVLRNGRGYSPLTIKGKIKRDILALGSEEKNTFAISQNGYIYLSQYIGDLKNRETFNTYIKAIENLTKILSADPKVFACDINENYISTIYGGSKHGHRVYVQHHHAHMVSCMVEYSLQNKVIGIIYDGTGLGLDERIWGGEFFLGDRQDFKRIAHLKYAKIQGGDASIKEPWRAALSYLIGLGLYDYYKIQSFKEIETDRISVLKKALLSGLNTYESSSMGRLFDCVASLLGIRNIITYDAQGAIELENIIKSSIDTVYSYSINEVGGVLEIEYKDIILGILRDLEKKVSKDIISTKFHNTICDLTMETTKRLRDFYGINEVVLSGGVFQNSYLLKRIYKNLKSLGFKVYYNKKIPINDSGISLGQLAVADARLGE